MLVVDDNATNRRILEEMLDHWQMKPALVNNGPAALETLVQAAVPASRSPWCCSTCRCRARMVTCWPSESGRQPEIAGTTLLLLTSSSQSGEIARRKELGINGALSKPIKQADLWKAIMRVLGMPLSIDNRGQPSPSEPPKGRAGCRFCWPRTTL